MRKKINPLCSKRNSNVLNLAQSLVHTEQRYTTCGRTAVWGLRYWNLRPSTCNLKHKIWRPCWRILKQNIPKARKSVDTMRYNLDSDVTKSYRMNAQFMFVNANDIYRIKPII